MSQPHLTEQPAFEAAPLLDADAAPLTNRGLSANLLADYEALQNDVRQARELAGDFQRQLAGKSNEVAGLKQVFDKTTRDLSHLEVGIRELREERHRLANEAMRAIALEHRMGRLTAERDQLRVEIQMFRDRDIEFAHLKVEVASLKEQLEVRRPAVIAPIPMLEQTAVKAALAEVSAAVHRLMTLTGSGAPMSAPPRPTPPPPVSTDEGFIDISFER